MLKILDVHLSASATGEYVVLQNQGITTLCLRGWCICSEAYCRPEADSAPAPMYVFADDIAIKPYTRVVLFSGNGQSGWYPTVDGKYAYVAYWGREWPVWDGARSIHVLQPVASRRLIPSDDLIAH